jgi:hypothetical protein
MPTWIYLRKIISWFKATVPGLILPIIRITKPTLKLIWSQPVTRCVSAPKPTQKSQTALTTLTSLTLTQAITLISIIPTNPWGRAGQVQDGWPTPRLGGARRFWNRCRRMRGRTFILREFNFPQFLLEEALFLSLRVTGRNRGMRSWDIFTVRKFAGAMALTPSFDSLKRHKIQSSVKYPLDKGRKLADKCGAGMIIRETWDLHSYLLILEFKCTNTHIRQECKTLFFFDKFRHMSFVNALHFYTVSK